MKDVNLETITDTQSWCKNWPLNGYNLICAKPKLFWRRKGVYENFSSRPKSQKPFTVTIPWSLAKNIKKYHGTVHRCPIDPRQMLLPRKQYAEFLKQELRQCFCYLAWMKNVGWFNGMFLLSAKCSRPPGRWEDALRTTFWRTICHLKAQSFSLPEWLNIIQSLRRTSQGSTNLVRGGIWKGDNFFCRH